MNIRGGLFRLWIAASAAWALGSGIAWYQTFAFEQTKIATLDECGKSYPPMPETSLTEVADRVYAAADAKQHHPRCVPNVNTIVFADFLSMPDPDREALHQDSENAIHSATQEAVVIGAGVPAQAAERQRPRAGSATRRSAMAEAITCGCLPWRGR